VTCRQIPATGWRGQRILVLATMLVVAGAAVLALNRRRRVRGAT